jgi:hypothetical protein
MERESRWENIELPVRKLFLFRYFTNIIMIM